MPLTTTVSASAAPTPSGTSTTSAASTSTWLAQPPILISAATRVPARPGLDTLAGRQHRADQVVAGHERERRLVVVPAAAHLLLGERDPGRLHPDHDLARAGGGDRSVPDLQPFRLHLARQDDLDESFGVHGDLRCVVHALLALRSL